jgi:tetratricopeptide (TPR) repeat protein/TolB-like protein
LLRAHATRTLVLALACVASATAALAQCPDGSLPPCGGAAPVRRANPPLSDNTWIVLPFENQSQSPEIDWMREASANLLYLDLSQWADIHVVDDERVADLMRDVPAPGGVQRLTQQSGSAVARRAGAGKLVMGDLLKVGSRTVLVAKVFDVRTGQRIRSVRDESSNPDSLMASFSRLARAIVDAAPAAGPGGPVAGTTHLDAYKEYVAGLTALNAFNTAEALARFRRAIQLDSTFALAHFKLSIVLGWTEAGDPAARTHAEAASRLSASLPARERALIAGQLAMAQEDYPRACDVYGALVRNDSADVEALYGLGECNFHDDVVLPVGGDSARLAFRSSWNTTLRVNRRILEFDPTYHLAFQHIQDALTAGARPGCRPVAGQSRCGEGRTPLMAVLIRSGDSLQAVPVSLADGGHAFQAQALEALHGGSVRRNLILARDIALQWVAAGPNETRARIACGGVLLRLGDIESADAQLRMAREVLGTIDRMQLAIARLEVAVKLDRYAEARRVLDSLVLARDTGAIGQVPILLGIAFGRLAEIDSMVQSTPVAPAFLRYGRIMVRVLMGLPADSLADAERALGPVFGPAGASRLTQYITGTLAFGPLDRPASDWTASDTTAPEGALRLVSVLASGDRDRLRRALVAFDSLVGTLTDSPDNGFRLLSARAHVLLGDTAAARRQLRSFADSTWRITPPLTPVGSGGVAMMLWPRMFLLQADLAAAAGDRAEAAQAYRRVIGFWEDGDPEVQPVVRRAREALARLAAP